jgi:hypothetical protein
MECIESIGFTPKILKFVFAQIMFFTDKKSKNAKKSNKNISVCHAPSPPPLTEICTTSTA